MHCNAGHFYAHNKTFHLQRCLWKQQIGRSIMPLNRVNHLPSERFKRLFIARWKALTIINTLHTVRCQSENRKQERGLRSTAGWEDSPDCFQLSTLPGFKSSGGQPPGLGSVKPCSLREAWTFEFKVGGPRYKLYTLFLRFLRFGLVWTLDNSTPNDLPGVLGS